MIFCVEDEQNICELEVYTCSPLAWSTGLRQRPRAFRFAGKAGA